MSLLFLLDLLRTKKKSKNESTAPVSEHVDANKAKTESPSTAKKATTELVRMKLQSKAITDVTDSWKDS